MVTRLKETDQNLLPNELEQLYNTHNYATAMPGMKQPQIKNKVSETFEIFETDKLKQELLFIYINCIDQTEMS